jgi:DNA/RNA-binding domain of Phe-tRNA-synthetase-like protein
MVEIAPELARIVKLGVLVVAGVKVTEADAQLDHPLSELADRMRATNETPQSAALVRTMYRRVGIDPTKTRPSSEALLRRVRKGESLPRINTLVDLCNWCSTEFQLPYGLYDRSQIDGRIELRRGRSGETYQGIRKDVVHLEGRMALCDERGPFGNPTSDSVRTMITPATDAALAIIYAPCELAADRLRAALEVTSSRIRHYAGGHERGRWIVPDETSHGLRPW